MAKRAPIKTVPLKTRKKPRIRKASLIKTNKPQIVLNTNRNVKSKSKTKRKDQIQAPHSSDISRAISESSPQSRSVSVNESGAKTQLSKKKHKIETKSRKNIMKHIIELNSKLNMNKDDRAGNKNIKAVNKKSMLTEKMGGTVDTKLSKTAGQEKNVTRRQGQTRNKDKTERTLDPIRMKAVKSKSAEEVMKLASKGIKRGRSSESLIKPGSVKKRKDDGLNQTLKDESGIIRVPSSADVSKTSNVQTDKVKKTLPSPKPKENKNLAAESTTKVSKQQLISVSHSVKKTSKVSLVSPNKKKKEQLKLSVANLIGWKKTDHNKDILHNGKPSAAKKKSGNKILKASKARKDSPDKLNGSVVIENSDSDDDDILYSLSDVEVVHNVDNNIGTFAPVKDNTDVSVKKNKKAVQEEKKAKKSKSISATEVVSKNNKSKKIRLLDSLKQTTNNKPGK